jgi:hypothetical protein
MSATGTYVGCNIIFQYFGEVALNGTQFLMVHTVLLTLSNPMFLPTAYSPALICFGQERGWWITCNYPTVLKAKNMEKQKEYNLRYLLAKVRTTRGKASDRLQQRANKRNKNRVGASSGIGAEQENHTVGRDST